MPGASGQIRGKARTSALSALTAALLAPAAAFGSSGEITRALANANWTKGDIVATVSWKACASGVEPPDCAWVPYMTIGPGVSPSECDSPERDWPGLGEGIVLAFGGGGFKGRGTYSYESSALSLRGTPELLACLFANERTRASDAPRPLRLDAALLAAPPPAPAPETEGPATDEEPAAMEEPQREDPLGEPQDEKPVEEPEKEPAALDEPQGEEPPESPPAEGEPAEGEEPAEAPQQGGPGVEEPPISPEKPVGPLVEEELPTFVDEPPQPPSGEITRALANTAWTRGNIAGSFTWDGCARTVGAPTSYCAWIPYATIGTGASRSECASPERDWSSLGEGVSLILWDGEIIGAGTREFDFPGIWLDGRSNRLLCLAVIEVTQAGTYTHRLTGVLLTPPPMVSNAKPAAEN